MLWGEGAIWTWLWGSQPAVAGDACSPAGSMLLAHQSAWCGCQGHHLKHPGQLQGNFFSAWAVGFLHLFSWLVSSGPCPFSELCLSSRLGPLQQIKQWRKVSAWACTAREMQGKQPGTARQLPCSVLCFNATLFLHVSLLAFLPFSAAVSNLCPFQGNFTALFSRQFYSPFSRQFYSPFSRQFYSPFSRQFQCLFSKQFQCPFSRQFHLAGHLSIGFQY